MQDAPYITSFFGLIFVIGIIFVLLWVLKYISENTQQSKLFKQLNKNKRLNIIESRRLDGKNTLMIIKQDDNEHLIVTGSNNIIIEKNIKPKEVEENNDEK